MGAADAKADLFELDAYNPSSGVREIYPGQIGSFGFRLVAAEGFTDSVTIALPGLPPGWDFSLTKAFLFANQIGYVRILPGPEPMIGSYPMQVVGTSGAEVDTLSVTLNVVSPPVCWDRATIASTRSRLTVTNEGSMGADIGRLGGLDPNTAEPLPAFEYPIGSQKEHLFYSILWIGGIVGSDTLVTTGHDGWNMSGRELNPNACPEGAIRPGVETNELAVLGFGDTLSDPSLTGLDDTDGRPHIALPIEVTQRILHWDDLSDANGDAFVFECKLKNIGAEDIESGWVGLNTDGDVGYGGEPQGASPYRDSPTRHLLSESTISGVTIGDTTVAAGGSAVLPVEFYTAAPLLSFSVPLTLENLSADSARIDSVVYNPDIFDSLIYNDDSSIFVFIPLQPPPLPDSTYTLGEIYMTAGSDSAGAFVIDTTTVSIGLETYTYEFIDTDTVSSVPAFDPGVVRVQWYIDDLTGYLPDEEIAYIIDNDGDPGYGVWDHYVSVRGAMGIKFLDPTSSFPTVNYNWWTSNGNPALDWGPRRTGTLGDPFRDFATGGIGTPVGDRNKYYILSHGENDYDQLDASLDYTAESWLPPHATLGDNLALGSDSRFLISTGPFDLPAGDSLTFAFAVAVGDNVHTDPNAYENLVDPANPGAFYSTLDFTNLVAKMNLAEVKYVALNIEESGNIGHLPTEFGLSQNYPNPFNPVTTIRYSLPHRSHVTLTVHNILGQKVATLVNTLRPPGNHTARWNGRDSRGRAVSSGVYFYRLTTEGFVDTRKMLLLK